MKLHVLLALIKNYLAKLHGVLKIVLMSLELISRICKEKI
jgi:hypothetical protein